MTSIELLILAKSDILSDGLLRILLEHEQLTVAHESRLHSAQEQLAKSHTDVLLVQAQLISPPFNYFFAKTRSWNPDLKILVFGQVMNNDFLLKIIRSGANGYINANMSTKHLIQAVHHVLQGKMWAERDILEQLARDALQMEQVLENIAVEKTRLLSDLLTKREAQVFHSVLKGLSTREIAEQIFLSEQSVKLHLGKLFKKFSVSNRPQLILSALEKVSPVNNLIPLMQMALEKKSLGRKSDHRKNLPTINLKH